MNATPPEPSSQPIPIVAIGASAGGLDPLEAFFEAAPTDAGWAFFVIQHLSPDYRSMMDELLARRSKLRIRHVEDGMAVQADTIYLNPPDTTVTLEQGKIALEPFAHDGLPNMPIDAFFHSLAAQSRHRSIAVVLSGSGADGARGATTLKQAGGKILVQTPGNAKFDSMPRAVIASGCADRVLDPAAMPAAIAEILSRPGPAPGKARPSDLPEDPHEAVLALLERNHGIDFGSYKRATVLRRIDRRRTLRGHEDIADYAAELQDDPDVVEELYQDLLIGVTEFYRDPEAFASLSRLVLPTILTEGPEDKEVRAWVPACASGEEAYSLAIAFMEAMRDSGVDRPLRIFATDVHRPSIERAAQGVYPRASLDKLPDDLKERYFVAHADGLAVEPGLRQKVIFSVHDVLGDPPFMRLDLISCRNLMIYLNDAAQSRLLALFQFGLRRNGFLFLGKSESLGRQSEAFAAVDSTWRLFRWKGERGDDANALTFTRTFDQLRGAPRPAPTRPSLQSLEMDQRQRRSRSTLLKGYDALLKRYAPSAILVSDAGEVLTWFGDASDYVDTLSDLAERTVEEIVHEGLHYAINVGIERIRRNKERQYRRQLELQVAGDRRTVIVGIEALEGDAGGRHFLITVEKIEKPVGDSEGAAGSSDSSGDEALMAQRIQELERDLKLTEESLQYVTERLETSGEELQASNEELQSSNEELQASNEELQSSNEELHAVNEELVNVSAEHQRKIDELTALNADMEFIFDTLGIGVVVLDESLAIRRMSNVASGLLQLMPHDTGRPLANVGASLGFADPSGMATEALRADRPVSARGRVGDEELIVRAVPYDHEDVPGGVAVLLIRPDCLHVGAEAAAQ
ncbi:chemotaxis protein CheB [Marinibaculum pumilum]|uniref:Chemotaxis protein CheB n=1 Tax=Marinibaculum pumilum TaxID=1766165 RepID=A0ABV7KU45_9PROT